MCRGDHLKKWQFQKGINHWNWKGGVIKNNQGYLYQLSPDHPNKNKNNRVAVHRLVMEKFLGRFLEQSEDVHHIDGNKENNDIENLQLVNHSDHQKLEMKGDINKWSVRYDKCVSCESDKNKHNAFGYCKQCYNKALRDGTLKREGDYYL